MAHGCTPAILGEPLVEEAVGAQRCGPAIPSVHCSAKRCGEGRIAELLHSGAGTGDGGGAGRARGFARDHASPRQRNMLDGVLEAHGRLAGIELTNTTHVDAPPTWQRRCRKGAAGRQILNGAIKGHCKGPIESRVA